MQSLSRPQSPDASNAGGSKGLSHVDQASRVLVATFVLFCLCWPLLALLTVFILCLRKFHTFTVFHPFHPPGLSLGLSRPAAPSLRTPRALTLCLADVLARARRTGNRHLEAVDLGCPERPGDGMPDGGGRVGGSVEEPENSLRTRIVRYRSVIQGSVLGNCNSM